MGNIASVSPCEDTSSKSAIVSPSVAVNAYCSSNFWHQCLRAPLQGVAKFITRGILRLPPSLLESYFTMLIIFILSGHFHILLDYCSGMTSWRLSGGVQCFALIVPGIMIEDCIQWLWGDFKAKSGIHGRQWLERTVGYIWTFLYLAAVTPVFNYPLQRVDRNPTYLIPWSFFKHFTQQGSTA